MWETHSEARCPVPTSVVKIVEAVREDAPTFSSYGEANGRGNRVFRAFHPSDRYSVDFADDFTSDGWEQFDTDQDAHYFGVWVNRGKRLTLCYAEGDWTLVECPDDASYFAEVRDLIAFHGEGVEAKAFGPDGVTVYRQNRERFLV